ncbi:glycosyltransferase [Actinomycetospora lemnae]|uniref:Glycosyltransferase n=1 Tax=Actinomycetospora lemnae TaxID=3019891 RepID=A0ABT5SVC0_9PSEU|nr:glycosyltransferase [Actinomycetospora sp. DW7H6]MDD7966805.1 glycosyltransferase [Actinomycetospora sp. DW7H6]
MARAVVVAHDWTIKYAGSERVVEQLLELYPDAPLITSVAADPPLPFLQNRQVRKSPLQRAPRASKNYEYYLPVMPLAWRMVGQVSEVDAVVSSSHACAHAIRVHPHVPQLNYCHTPMRYAWDFESEKHRFPVGSRSLAKQLMRAFRRWDRRKAQTVTKYVANSSAVATRIEKFYGRAASVIHPPVDVDYFSPTTGSKIHEPYFLYVGRLVSYKRADLAVEAFADLPYRLVVVGEGHLSARLRATATPNVSFRGGVSKSELRELYRHATALVFPADEDFGITMAEAIACGTPVISLARGGALDIVEPGQNGWLMERPTSSALAHLARVAVESSLPATEVSSSSQRFAPAVFKEKMAAAVEEMIAGYRRGASIGAPRSGGPPARWEVQADA